MSRKDIFEKTPFMTSGKATRNQKISLWVISAEETAGEEAPRRYIHQEVGVWG